MLIKLISIFSEFAVAVLPVNTTFFAHLVHDAEPKLKTTPLQNPNSKLLRF